MRRHHAPRTRLRFLRRLATALGVVALALVLASPAAAHKKSKHRPGHGPRVVHHVTHVRPLPLPLPARYTVPAVIRPARVEAYRPYFRGHVFHGPHGHAHAVYLFPVHRGGYVVREPYHYCHGELFVGGRATVGGPHLSFHIAF